MAREPVFNSSSFYTEHVWIIFGSVDYWFVANTCKIHHECIDMYIFAVCSILVLYLIQLGTESKRRKNCCKTLFLQIAKVLHYSCLIPFVPVMWLHCLLHCSANSTNSKCFVVCTTGTWQNRVRLFWCWWHWDMQSLLDNFFHKKNGKHYFGFCTVCTVRSSGRFML